MYAKRPKRGETDDDLLAFQEEFLRHRNSSIPAAKVVRTSTTEHPAADEENAPSIDTRGSHDDLSHHAATSIDYQAQHVLGIIQESTKNLDPSIPSKPLGSPEPSITSMSHGFPEVPILPPELLNTPKPSIRPKGKQKSLFARQLEAKKLAKPKLVRSDGEEMETSDSNDRLNKLEAEIHSENSRRLAEMTQDEIEEERQDILNNFDPSLIDILRNRKHKAPKVSGSKALKDHILSPPSASKDVVSQIDISELPVKPEPGWLHMDKIEHDKLKWLTDVKPSEKNKTDKFPARFDFSGNLVSPECDLSANKGLHHHGEQPDLPGYTLEELYTLVRSLNMSQKILALTTISNVVGKAKAGTYSTSLKAPIIHALLEADIVPLLRYALDDKSDLVIAATISAFHSLLINETDEVVIKSHVVGFRGHELPQLSPPVLDDDTESIDDQYLEVLKKDVVAGLLQMSFIERLRYVLEVCCPQQKVCSKILDILARLAQTSPETAYKITQCPRLMDVIMAEFLPLSWSGSTVSDDDVLYGHPSAEAIRFIQVLCSSGRNMAANLLVRRGVMERIVCYWSAYNHCLTETSQDMIIECFRLWRTLALYKLTTDTFCDLYPSLLTGLRPEANERIQASLICFLEAMLCAAASITTGTIPKKVHFGDSCDTDEAFPSSAFNWTHVAGLIDPIYCVLKNRFANFLEKYALMYSTTNLEILTAGTNFLASYLMYTRVQSPSGDWSIYSQNVLQELCEWIKLLLTSTAFPKLMALVRKHSVILSEVGFLSDESPLNLPSLGSVSKHPADSTVSQPMNYQPQLYFQALVRLIQCLTKCNYAASKMILKSFICHTELQTYIRQVGTTVMYNSNNYFIRHELETLALVCQLATIEDIFCTKELHKLALTLVSLGSASSVAVLYDLLNSVVFHSHFYRTVDSETLNETVSCIRALPSMSTTFITLALPSGQTLKRAQNLKERCADRIDRLSIPSCSNSMLPSDWPFMPIVHLYQQSTAVKIVQSETAHSISSLVKSCLQFIYLLERCQPDIVRNVPLHAKIARVMCTFLLDMQQVLNSLLKIYSQRMERLDFSKPVPGLVSFIDLYAALIDQYDSVSFGDPTFAQYVLLPMCQRQSADLRGKVWSNNSSAIRSITVSPSQLVFPVKELLYPEEQSVDIVRSMARHLLGGVVTLKRNPLLYIISLHHVNRYMFTSSKIEEDTRKSLLKAADYCTNEPLAVHLTRYKQYDPEVKDNIEIFDRLPEHRARMLNSRH